MSLPAHAAVKPGTSCKKLGQTSFSSSKKYTCIKSGKKLIWNKGVIIKSPTTSSTPTSSTPTSSSAQKNETSQTSASQNQLVSKNIDECKIKDARIKKIQPNNVGFPLTEDIIPNKGVLKMVFIPIDFADAPGNSDPYLVSNSTFTQMKDWYTYFSNGKFKIEAQQSHEWFRSSTLS